MTDNEYLAELHTLEGVGDKSGIPTSKKYGITSNGIEMVSQAIRKKDGGDYIQSAKQIQGILSKELRNTLLKNITWKDGKMTKWASLQAIEKYGEKGLAQLALAIRQIHQNQIDKIPAAPISEEMRDRLCLAAHNRPGILKDKDVIDAIQSNNEECVRHEAMNYLKNVSQGNMLGIKRRLASLFNPDWTNIKPSQAWVAFDQNGKAGISKLVDKVYEQDAINTAKRLNREAESQAALSWHGQEPLAKATTNKKSFPNQQKFMSDLIPQKAGIPVAPAQDNNGSKTAPKRSFFAMLGDAISKAVNPFYGVSGANFDQVANSEQNMLNNNNGEQV